MLQSIHISCCCTLLFVCVDAPETVRSQIQLRLCAIFIWLNLNPNCYLYSRSLSSKLLCIRLSQMKQHHCFVNARCQNGGTTSTNMNFCRRFLCLYKSELSNCHFEKCYGFLFISFSLVCCCCWVNLHVWNISLFTKTHDWISQWRFTILYKFICSFQ